MGAAACFSSHIPLTSSFCNPFPHSASPQALTYLSLELIAVFVSFNYICSAVLFFPKHMLNFLCTFNPSHLMPHYKQVKFTLYYLIHPYHFQTNKINSLLLSSSLASSAVDRATSAGTTPPDENKPFM